VSRARVSIAGIDVRKPPPVHTQVRVRAGELRLSRLRYGSERPYLVVPVGHVTAAKGDGPGTVTLQLDGAKLTIALAGRRTRRKFLSALGR